MRCYSCNHTLTPFLARGCAIRTASFFNIMSGSRARSRVGNAPHYRYRLLIACNKHSK